MNIIFATGSTPGGREINLGTLIMILCFLLALVLPIWMWQKTLNDPINYLSSELPKGQIFYIFSKLSALYALTLCWLQMIIALWPSESTKLLKRKPSVHYWLGGTFLAAMVLHIALFVTAVSLRNGHFASGLLTLRINNGSYDLIVSLGLLSAIVFFVVAMAGFMTKKGVLSFKSIHRLSFLGFFMFFVHGLAIGTESRLPQTLMIYAGMGSSVLVLVIYQLSFRGVLRGVFRQK